MPMFTKDQVETLDKVNGVVEVNGTRYEAQFNDSGYFEIVDLDEDVVVGYGFTVALAAASVRQRAL